MSIRHFLKRSRQALVILAFAAALAWLAGPYRQSGEEGAGVRAEAPAPAPDAAAPAAENAADAATPWLDIVGRVPLEGDLFDGRLFLFFNTAIQAPFDADGNLLPPLLLEPALPGAFAVKENCVQFTAENPANLGALILGVRPSEQLRGTDGRAPNPAAAPINLLTRAYTAERMWVIEKSGDALVLGLNFTFLPDMTQLAAFLTIVDNAQQSVAFTVELGTSDKGAYARVRLPGNVALPITITVAPGVPDASGRVVTREGKQFIYPMKDPLRVERLYLDTSRDEQSKLSFKFSGKVAPADLTARLHVNYLSDGANLPFTLEGEGAAREHEVLLTEEVQPGQTIVVTLDAGLTAEDFSVMRQPFSKQLKRETKPLRLESHWWNNLGKDGVELRFYLNEPVSLDALRQHAAFEPEVPGLEFVHEGWSSFSIRGDFRSEGRYRLILQPGLADNSGNYAVSEREEIALDIVPRAAGAGFGYAGKYYFPRRQGTEFLIESRNRSEAQITVSRLFPSNIAVALEAIEDGSGSWEFDDRWAEVLKTTKVVFRDAPDALVRTPVELRALFDDNWRGVFRLSVDDGGSGKIVVWTDIGALAHWQEDEVVIFAHDLTTLEPIAGAQVTVYSHKNQVVGTANTDAQGIALVRGLNPALGAPQVAVIETSKDYTFLELERREDDPVTYNEDMPAFDKDGYDAFLYADRDLYRPGETVYLHWLVRTNYGDALPNVPLKLTVNRPNGSVYVSEAVALSELGTGGRSLQTDKSDPTGRYTVQLSAPGDPSPIGMYYFSVEEFVPNRIAVETALDPGLWTPGGQYPIHVQARHLFGAPAAERKCEAEVALLKGDLKTEQWREYRFTNSEEYKGEIVPAGSAQTDAEGKAEFTFNVELPGEVTFPVRALVRGRVFELGGRAVTSTRETTVFPGEVCLGLRCAEAADHQGVEVFVAAIRPDESPAPLEKVKVILEREEWSYYVRAYDGYNDWEWTKVFEEKDSRDVPLTEGRGSTVFPLSGWGYYRVKVVSDATTQYSDQQFYGYWDGRVELVDQARPSLLKLTLNQQEYTVGEEVEARLESPFDGVGYVVVQGENISRAQAVQIVDGVGLVRFAVGDEEVPNVWIEATVVHKAAEDSAHVYPYASFAMANAVVRNPRRMLAVSFPGLPEETRPAQDWQVAIETRDHAGAPVAAEVTVAAVDEGIHALTDYATPEPYAWVMRSRQPDFSRAHYYDRVAYDFGKTPIGGDAIARRFGKDAPFVGDNWIKPVALWSGVVRTDETGRGLVTFSLPEYSGQLRLVAVACTQGAVGATGQDIYVRRPYMLRTSMPRFALPGDRFQCRAAVFNTTAAPCTARISWKAQGALTGGEGSKEIAVEPSRDASAMAEFAAGMAMGQGTILWQAEIVDAAGAVVETLKEEAPIPVRPPAMYQTTHELAVLGPGESRTFKNAQYIDAANTTLDMSVSADPTLRLRDALKYVVGYPYGCVEQTTSRCLPMYLLRRDTALLGAALEAQWPVDHYLQAGVDRLFSMQTGGGGLGGWPGAATPYAYGSVYACHFLTLARRDHELKVPEQPFKALQDYVRAVANDWDDSSDTYENYHGYSALYMRAYAHYVLALDGDIEAIRGIERFDTLSLPAAARYLLAAALAMNTQDTDRVKLYLSSAPSEPYDVTEQDGTLNSDIRNEAVRLIALLQIDGSDPACFETVNKLTRYLETHRYGSTQETAFIVTALAMYYGRLEEQLGKAAATIVTPKGDSVQLDLGAGYRGKHEGPGGLFVVTNTGVGPIFVSFTVGGTPAQAETQAISEGFQVVRDVRSVRDGAAVSGEFRQGDSYIVEITLQASDESKNVIVDDPLPAGFEIENPRLDPDLLAGVEIPEAMTPTYLEVRDDRYVAAFDALAAGEHHLYYIVRAVTPGTFQRPGARTECMYDAAVRGTCVPETIAVK